MIKPIYIKYELTDNYLREDPFGEENRHIIFYAKVSKDRITLRSENRKKDFEFTNSSPELVKKMCNLILEVLKINE